MAFFDKKPGSSKPWTQELWIYDLRTNKDFTLKTNALKREDLDEFVEVFKPGARQHRKATFTEKKPEGSWRAYGIDELFARDKVSFDITRLKVESLEHSANLPAPEIHPPRTSRRTCGPRWSSSRRSRRT